MILLRLFYEFFKTGLFAVGGGMATLPFLYDISTRTCWYTHEKLADMIAVSESTPGPIGVNMATYVGFETAGIPGAVIATLGLVTPSIMIILLIARALKAFRENPYVEAGFYGLQLQGTRTCHRAAGLHAVYQEAQRPAPDCVHPRLGSGRHRVLILKEKQPRNIGRHGCKYRA